MKPTHQSRKSPEKYSSSKNTRDELLSDHEWVIVQLRKDTEESGTRNRDSSKSIRLTALQEQGEDVIEKST